jgi:hypothetical protein
MVMDYLYGESFAPKVNQTSGFFAPKVNQTSGFFAPSANQTR